MPPWEADPDQWWPVVEANLRGPYLLTRAVVPGMIARGGGRILNTSLASSPAGRSSASRTPAPCACARTDRTTRSADQPLGCFHTHEAPEI